MTQREGKRRLQEAAPSAGLGSKEPIHEQILPLIRRDIIENRWRPGQRLPEPELCTEFGVSRTPMREVQWLHRAMIRAVKSGQVRQYYTMNDEFHRLIVLGANNPTLSRLHENIMWHVFRARHHANEHEPVAAWAAEQHRQIVDALMD